jgi:hypothetical protein
VGTVDTHHVLLPMNVVNELGRVKPRRVEINGRMYSRMVLCSGQPDLE